VLDDEVVILSGLTPGQQVATSGSFKLREAVLVAGDSPVNRKPFMRSFTDTFIKHPVLAVVVNLVIVLVGWRAITTLPVQQYPNIQSSSVLITTVYYGASAETVRGFLTTPIERAVSAISASTTSNPPAAPAFRASRCT